MKFKYSVLSLIAASAVHADVINIPVSQDGWIDGWTSNRTVVMDDGIGVRLNVATPNPAGAWQYTRKAWFGFDLSTLPSGPMVNITGASITFTKPGDVGGAYNGANSMRFTVIPESTTTATGAATSDFFGETALTWNNAPGNRNGAATTNPVDGTVFQAVPIPNPAANGIQVFDDPGLITELVADSNNFLTVAAYYLGQNNSNFNNRTGLGYVTKEAGTGSAVLTVTFTNIPEPATAAFFAAGSLGLWFLHRRRRR